MEQTTSRGQLVEDRSGRVDVGALIHLLPEHLLGRHVGWAPDRLPEPCLRRRLFGRVRLRLDESRYPEIADLEEAVFREPQVRGLEVPVDDPLPMRRVESARELRPQARNLLRGQCSPTQLLRDGRPGHQLHHQEVEAVGPVRVEEHCDVRVAEPGKDAGLVAETAAGVVVGKKAGGKDLERHLAVQPLVPRPVDLTHLAGPERRQDPVVGEAPSDHAHPRAQMCRFDGIVAPQDRGYDRGFLEQLVPETRPDQPVAACP